MQDFFTRLKQEREDSGLTLDEIFNKTRLSVEYLTAIEEGELKKLPKGYDRIFMKTYLLAIGVDVESYLEEFDRLLGRREPTQVIDLDDLERDRQKRDLKINHGIKYLLLWMPVVLILSFLIYLFISFGEDEAQVENSSAQIPEIKVEDYISDIDTMQTAVATPEKIVVDSLKIELTGIKRTWVRSVIDRRDTLEFTLTRNINMVLEADSVISFVIGKGDGISIQTGDSIYRNIAPSGQVIKRLVIDKNGIRELIHAVPASKTTGQ